MSFDLLAPHYSWMELLLAGERLQRCRSAFLEDIGPRRRALVIGEGHGRFLEACLRNDIAAEIVCVDASRGMLETARRRIGPVQKRARVQFCHGDILHTNLEGTFDLIATHFFLDCFPPRELQAVVAKISSVAEPGSVWAVADFMIPESGWKRERAKAIHWIMYAFFRRFTGLRARRVTPPDSFLKAAGFELQARRFSEWGLLHTDLWRKA